MTHTYLLIAALPSSHSRTESTSSHPRKIIDADQIWKKSTAPSSVHKELSYGAKIAKIGPVYPEYLTKYASFFGCVIPDVHK